MDHHHLHAYGYQGLPLTIQQKGFLGIEWPDAHERPLFYVGVYGAIALATGLFGVLSSIAQYTGALKASRTLFKQLLVAVVRATMRWHDVTPQGWFLIFESEISADEGDFLQADF